MKNDPRLQRYSRSLSAIAVTAALLGASPVLAQQDNTNDSKKGGLERIEVTARKTVESLQEVPVSITSVGAVELAEKALVC